MPFLLPITPTIEGRTAQLSQAKAQNTAGAQQSNAASGVKTDTMRSEDSPDLEAFRRKHLTAGSDARANHVSHV